MEKKIRNPIVTVAGHVDHGKTSILDSFRKSSVQEKEAGGITQKISFTLLPLEQLKTVCPLIEKSGIKLKIPGFLFIDTPGHAAFTNLRKRGGSLADIAILVIDINEGIKPQTSEVIQILKHNKTPFIIALNKIDNISGWRKMDDDLKKSIDLQSNNTKQAFDERYMTLIGSLNNLGFDADLFNNISDFRKKIALVPCSAKTKEGISELLFVLSGLSQKYLENKLELNKDAKGVLLEIKKEKSINYSESILYNGELGKEDEIAISNLNGEAIITKIRILEEIIPLSAKFTSRERVKAATGLRMQFSEKIDVLPGMPFMIYKGNKEKIQEIFKKEISDNIKTQKKGIIAKAESLGSLEALLVLLKQNHIPVVKAGIGNINKSDMISAKANLEINELDAIIVGFNVDLDEEAKSSSNSVKVLTEEVIYKLIDETIEFRKEKEMEMEKKRILGLASLTKLKVLPQHVFRNTSPAIFGVRVEAGSLTPGTNLINLESGLKIGRVKNLQHENKSVPEANEGLELAISIPGINFERKMKDVNFIGSDISESQFRNFKKNKDLLSRNEIFFLEDIAEIKRQKKSDWGI